MLPFVLATRERRPRQRLELVPPAKPAIHPIFLCFGNCKPNMLRHATTQGKKNVCGPTGLALLNSRELPQLFTIFQFKTGELKKPLYQDSVGWKETHPASSS
jgi:hypothetical protein